jgi:hypothetical protein
MLSARFKEWSTQGKAEPVPEEGFQVDERFVDTTSPAELGGLQIPMMGSGVVTEGVSGSWSKKSPPVAMGVSPVRAGGLTNAIAAATSNNQVLQQTAPADRPQPGTSAMRDFFVLPWNSVYFNASYGNVPWPVRVPPPPI